jgi:hypothetical protein
MAKHVMLPRLKVFALPSGEIVTNHREGPLPPVGDGWWQDVLLDPRAHVPTVARFDGESGFAYLRLDRQHGEELMFTCDCGRARVWNKAHLVSEFGADANADWLARELSDCRARNKMDNWCRARCLR